MAPRVHLADPLFSRFVPQIGRDLASVRLNNKSPRASGSSIVVEWLFTPVGAWLSLVEHSVRDRGVGGSNPLAPTTFSLANPRCSVWLAARFRSKCTPEPSDLGPELRTDGLNSTEEPRKDSRETAAHRSYADLMLSHCCGQSLTLRRRIAFATSFCRPTRSTKRHQRACGDAVRHLRSRLDHRADL